MDRIEVYQFERGAALLCTRRAVHGSHVERVARRLAQPGAVLLRELLGAIRVLIAAPLHVALQLVRCVADSTRDSVGGASDALLKPLIVLAFNALLRPPLLLAGATCTALREAVHPAVLLLGDILEAAARPLAALRLVHVERGCACACRTAQRV
ncbi:uncharacterized protein [Maniola hyperantus]|uniref:uncharacterized protein n=1 Tax=Aphantopus hyperantus TaxID=2795564 RepID=UPI003747B0A7